MADKIYIDATKFKAGTEAFEKLTNSIKGKVDDILNANILQMEYYAKRLAPADRGQLRQSISADTSTPLKKTLTCSAPYAAYVEFGTGKYAAQEVAKLPDNWKAYAMQFKGKTGGGFHEFINAIVDWVIRKGLAATYNVKTGARDKQQGVSSTYNTGQKGYKVKSETQRAFEIAYFVALNILKNGVHPHPFMFPAYFAQQRILLKDFQNLEAKFKK